MINFHLYVVKLWYII